MNTYDSVYNQKLMEAWKKFINNEVHDYDFIRPDIFESWKRSRSYLVDPYHPKTALLPPEDLEKRIQENQLLMEIARPYMEKLYSVVKGSGFYLLLSDEDGYVLDLIGDEEIVERGREYSKLVVGANRSERYAGTNAIGTGLVLQKPFQMWGGEHYIKPHKDYSCSSAPIFDADNNLLGLLNITGRFTEAHPHTLGMIMSAVDGISNELKRKAAYVELEKLYRQRNRIIETMGSGFILLNKDNEIVEVNSKVLSMLKLKNKDVIGKSLFDFIRFDKEDMEKSTLLNQEIYNKEVNVYSTELDLPPNKFNMSLNFLYDYEGQQDGTLLRFNETKRINRLAHQISGYKPNYTFDSIIGSSQATRDMIYNCVKAGVSNSNVLVLGESGTGKELVAQSIHNASKYAAGPFVAINCGAMPRGLVESELFGYERGAFTGANRDGHLGKFELADGGTLFLDEIGEMPLDVQVTLLRVLETKKVLRIGGKYPKEVDVRIIAATNKDLRKAIEDKTFRSDLYYRLNVFFINVPPLRERGDDFRELADHFVKEFGISKGIEYSIDPQVYSIFSQYHWPGNIQELENVIERAVNVAEGSVILPRHLSENIFARRSVLASESSDMVPYAQGELLLESSEHQLILASLEKSGGNIKRAAELLGISRRTLYRKMKKYEIDYTIFR